MRVFSLAFTIREVQAYNRACMTREVRVFSQVYMIKEVQECNLAFMTREVLVFNQVSMIREVLEFNRVDMTKEAQASSHPWEEEDLEKVFMMKNSKTKEAEGSILQDSQTKQCTMILIQVWNNHCSQLE